MPETGLRDALCDWGFLNFSEVPSKLSFKVSPLLMNSYCNLGYSNRLHHAEMFLCRSQLYVPQRSPARFIMMLIIRLVTSLTCSSQWPDHPTTVRITQQLHFFCAFLCRNGSTFYHARPQRFGLISPLLLQYF